VGTTICRVCGREVHRDSPESAAAEILNQIEDGTRFFVLFPAQAGLQVELNGDGVGPKTRRPGEAGARRKNKSPRPPNSASPPHLNAAHLLNLMQPRFT